MGCIRVREGDGIVNVFTLDGCGSPVLGATSRLSLTDISEVGWEDVIDEGDQVTERNFGGRKCYSDSGADELQHIGVNITTCGLIPALDTLLMSSNSKTRSGGIVGFGRTDLDSSAGVLVEILIELDAVDCSGSGDVPVFGVLLPLVKNWRPNGGATLNGSNLLKPQYTGKGYKNPNLEGHFPSQLAHWETVFDADEWYTAYAFDGANLSLDNIGTSCDALPATAGS